MENHAIVLYSGGPDSYITLKWAKNQVYASVTPCYVQLGHRYQTQELDAVIKTAPESQICHELMGLGAWEEDNAFIYGRNAFLCLVASRMLPSRRPGTVLLTVQEDEMELPDRSKAFLAQMGRMLSLFRGEETRVVSPWETADKTDMVKWYLKHVDEDVEFGLMTTHSCYSPTMQKGARPLDILAGRGLKGLLPCGNCSACFRRAVAFEINGLVEHYAQDPFESETAREYAMRLKRGDFSAKRADRIVEALRLHKERTHG